MATEISQDEEGYWYVSGSSGYLENYSDEQKYNATKLRASLMELGWTSYSICAIFGALCHEGHIDPHLIQGHATIEEALASKLIGIGLVQWTPATSLYNQLTTWGVQDKWYLASNQVRMLEYERVNGLQYYATKGGQYRNLWDENFSKDPPTTFTQFISCTASDFTTVEMSAAWVEFYERPGSWKITENWTRNAEDMQKWLDYFGDEPGPTPTTTKKKMPLWFYLKRRY